MTWWDDVSGFVKDNANIIKPIAQLGFGALKQSTSDNTESQYLQYLKDREQKNYDDSVAAIQAYNLSAGGGSGGGGAAMANQAGQQRAARKANKSMQETYKKILAMYAPYKDTADRLLPQMTHTYENSLGLQNALSSFISSPEQMAKLNGSVPAYSINIPLPKKG